jgi:hypothetical protein
MFPSSRLAILFTGMFVVITFIGLPPASVGLLFDLLFEPKDGGYIFLLKMGLSPIYAVLNQKTVLFVATVVIISNLIL